MKKLLTFCAAFVAAILVLAGTAGAETTARVGFSQGVSASWLEVGKGSGGETIFFNFSLSGGWNTQQEISTSSSTASWSVQDYRVSFSKSVCPALGGVCEVETLYSSPVTSADFSFSGNERVQFSRDGYIFVFVADHAFNQESTQELKGNSRYDGGGCSYYHQNTFQWGNAYLVTPTGAVLYPTPGGGTSSVYTDWEAENRKSGTGDFLPSCLPYYGGKG